LAQDPHGGHGRELAGADVEHDDVGVIDRLHERPTQDDARRWSPGDSDAAEVGGTNRIIGDDDKATLSDPPDPRDHRQASSFREP
jgi:hypothetical protein